MSHRRAVYTEVNNILGGISKLHSNEGCGLVRQPVYERVIRSSREALLRLTVAERQANMDRRYAEEPLLEIIDFEREFPLPNWRGSTPKDWAELSKRLRDCLAYVLETDDPARMLDPFHIQNRIKDYLMEDA